jgi:hypothetical protein
MALLDQKVFSKGQITNLKTPLSILTIFPRIYLKSSVASNKREALAYDDIRRMADPFLFQKLVQGQIF